MDTRSALPLATKGTQELFTNNIYETFMVIYGHLRDAVGKGAGAVTVLLVPRVRRQKISNEIYVFLIHFQSIQSRSNKLCIRLFILLAEEGILYELLPFGLRLMETLDETLHHVLLQPHRLCSCP